MKTIKILKKLCNRGLVETLPLDGLKLYILFLLFAERTDIWSSIEFITIKKALGGTLSLKRIKMAITYLERYNLAKVIYPRDRKRFLSKGNNNFIINYILHTPSFRGEKG